MDIIKLLHSGILNPSNYIVNIGASNGSITDPIYNFIIDSKYRGLCIEGNKDNITELKRKTEFDICNEYVYPHNIISIFNNYNVPIDIDVLKIDIDGFDLQIIREILSVYKPKIIIAEINEKIPPPILFEVLYKENYRWNESHFFGFSIKSGEAVMNKFGYKIIRIHELNNIICINHDLCNIFGLDTINNVEQLYKAQYIDILERLDILPWNRNINYWLEIKHTESLKNEIINYFCNNNISNFQNKNKILNVDFIVDI